MRDSQLKTVDRSEIEDCVNELKTAFEREAEMSADIDREKAVFTAAQEKYSGIKNQVDNIATDIQNIKKDIQENHSHIPCFVSDHALVRYLEEGCGMDLSSYRQAMLKKMHAADDYKEITRPGRPVTYHYQEEKANDTTIIYVVVDSVCTTCIIKGISNEDKGKEALLALKRE